MKTRNRFIIEMVVFLSLTMILGAVVYIPIIKAGTINGGQSTFASLLMLAPMKGFCTFEQSAHSPLFEEPEKLQHIMQKDVLAGNNSLADTK
jgi:hypothetical protein